MENLRYIAALDKVKIELGENKTELPFRKNFGKHSFVFSGISEEKPEKVTGVHIHDFKIEDKYLFATYKK